MDSVVNLKNVQDDFEVEFDVISPIDLSKATNDNIIKGLSNADRHLEKSQKELDEINAQIERLTNSSDGIDYMVAVASGIIAAIIDSFWVGEVDFSIESCNEVGNEKANNFVIKIAQRKGYSGNDLPGAVKYLEDNFPIAADKATNDFGGGLQHHLREFSHHPTPLGLIFSLLTQFTHKVYGTDAAGIPKVVELRSGDLALIGKNFPEKFTFGVVNWFFHMVSDMAGSSSSVLMGKGGTGLPGPIGSMLKELSALPFFKSMNENGHKQFSVWVSKLFNGTLDESGKNTQLQKFDLRTEIGIVSKVAKQAVPVIINECIVRGFYFIRRFHMEITDKKIKRISQLHKVNLHNILPLKNRTIVRMLTISTGTFTAIDLADAAIRSAARSGGFISSEFLSNMMLRVNFVGVGRFTISVGTDVCMGLKREILRNERIKIYEELITWSNVKLFYKQADMWISAENAGKTIDAAYSMIETTMKILMESIIEMKDNMTKICEYIPAVEDKNPGLARGITDILTWG